MRRIEGPEMKTGNPHLASFLTFINTGQTLATSTYVCCLRVTFVFPTLLSAGKSSFQVASYVVS